MHPRLLRPTSQASGSDDLAVDVIFFDRGEKDFFNTIRQKRPFATAASRIGKN
jgi:hypothetical protein